MCSCVCAHLLVSKCVCVVCFCVRSCVHACMCACMCLHACGRVRERGREREGMCQCEREGEIVNE